MSVSAVGPDAIVLGAGVVGVATALYLQRAGLATRVLDPLPPGGGASFGNAGMISADTVTPVALPGMLRQVPKWLADPSGPLAVRPSYLPRALPWLLRWLREGRMTRVRAISDAMRAINRDAFACWRDLLGAEAFNALVRRSGQIQIWEGDALPRSAVIDTELRARHGIAVQELGADDLRQMLPGLSPEVRHGRLVPGNGYLLDPGGAVAALAGRLRAEGGAIHAERAMKLIPRAGGGWTVMTNIANHTAPRVVVAAGAWSRTLLAPLGLRVPLETERGYHATLPAPTIDLRFTIIHKSRGFGLTSMADGLRVAGTVEIAGLDAPPDERRAEILVAHAHRLFPGLAHGEPRLWMGFRPSTPDSLPVLGEAPGRPGLFLAFGHGHFGMTGGLPSARLVAALMTGAAPPIDPAPYRLGRFAA
ncbi:MAG: FAD-dependent oxidoreductase [Rhodospirillales bacterium]|nr:FAD-dependent oxidoreductase [Rhodospirillales bacterium]